MGGELGVLPRWREAAGFREDLRPGVDELVFDADVIVAVEDIAAFQLFGLAKIAQPVIEVVEPLLEPGVELFAEDEITFGERGIDPPRRISDRRVLKLLRQWLRAGVMEEGVVTESLSGTRKEG